MTIIVGMIGSDGIVLATDQRMVRQAEHERDIDDISGIRKIHCLDKYGVAYAAAGDEVPWHIGRALADSLTDGLFDFTSIGKSLGTLLHYW